MSKVSGFPSPGLGCPLESGSQVSTIFVLGSAEEIVQGCGESEPCPSVVSTLRYQHRGNPPGQSPFTQRPAAAGRVTSSSSSPGHKPARLRGEREMATGPNEDQD